MTTRVWLAFLAVCLIWGTPYFFIKHAVHDLSPVWVAWGRLLCASLVLVPVALWRGQLRGVLKHWPILVVFAIVELVAPYGIKELARTGVIAMARGMQPSKDDDAPHKTAPGKRVRSIGAAAGVSLPPS